MGTKQIKELPAEVKQVRGQLEEWRGQRRHGQRIPEELWGAAVRAARRHGLNLVGRALGLDYYQLKRRLGPNEAKKRPAQVAEAVFVELAASKPEGADGLCVVELEKENGAKVRVSVRDASAVDWRQVKEAFLGA
jgi:hypothetical protein